MAKYNELNVISDNIRYVFVTRGRAKPFSMEEAQEYLKNKTAVLNSNPEQVEVLENVEPNIDWDGIPNVKERMTIFLNDLNNGLDFCANKYGVSKDKIIEEARRIAPHLNIRTLK